MNAQKLHKSSLIYRAYRIFYSRFEVRVAVTMNINVLLNVTPCILAATVPELLRNVFPQAAGQRFLRKVGTSISTRLSSVTVQNINFQIVIALPQTFI
jgi:hypothetical protein